MIIKVEIIFKRKSFLNSKIIPEGFLSLSLCLIFLAKVFVVVKKCFVYNMSNMPI